LTVQGEGPSAGRRCAFVRLSGCNLTCTWCDTPYTWDWTRFDKDTESRGMTVPQILAELAPMRVGRVVVTGGEPLTQRETVPLLTALVAAGYTVEVETNGTRPPPDVDVQWNVSPKLAHSGVVASKRIKPRALTGMILAGAVFKFVAESATDLDEVADIVAAHSIPADSVWVMPEGVTGEGVATATREIGPAVVDKGWNLSTRLHVLVWGDERGN
jgi:7-carboxy-7-deazaguanine synthase